MPLTHTNHSPDTRTHSHSLQVNPGQLSSTYTPYLLIIQAFQSCECQDAQ